MEVLIKKYILQEELYFKNALLLSYKIEYPQFLLTGSRKKNINKINKYYKDKALHLQKEAKTRYYKNAVDEYLYSVEYEIPVRKHELMSVYEITLNENCALSLYTDLYEYLGGAHGNTTRSSDTWNLNNLSKINLSDLFEKSYNYQKFIISSILNQISYEMRNEDEFMYFEDYRKNVILKFDGENFYLAPLGIMIYYQLYDIAPYVTGIPEFFIIRNQNMKWPDCK